jgi:endoglucanase
MKKKVVLPTLIFLFIIYFLFSCSYSDEIYIDQIGYPSGLPKTAMVEGPADQFKITDLKGQELLSREKGPIIKDKNTGKAVAKIDFSEITLPGNYYVCFGKAQRKITIADNPYEKILRSALKTFYLQRCGMAIDDKETGLKHGPCHTKGTDFLPSTGKSGRKNVCGGWHDAGDYGKYVPPANYAVSTLLFYYPLITELKYEIDWMLAMQDPKSGGVYHKVAGKSFEPFILPDQDQEPRFIFRISTAATAGFAGTMAQAALAFRKHDPAYSRKLLSAAQNAWRFLEKNRTIVPPGGFNNDPDVTTGVYGDTDDGDERLFAAAELIGATGEQKYQDYFARHYDQYDPGNTAVLGWQDFRHHAYISYLLLPEKLTSAGIRTKVMQRFVSFAETLVARGRGNGFNVVLRGEDYRWGSNGLLMDYAKALIFAHLFTGETKYKELALEQLHYILGRNAHNICFVTGFGEKTVTQLHHRPSLASGRELPGYMAGGPNKFLQDEVVRTIFRNDTPPALAYLDDRNSYSTNENSIYWNASLAFVLGYFCR